MDTVLAGLPRNSAPIRLATFVSLGLVFLPAVLFALVLAAAHHVDPRFAWLASPGQFPWQLWAIAVLGTLATAGGIGDWLYHRTHVVVGPREHHGHVQALALGSVVFALMATASWATRPSGLLVPILVALLATTALICHDEFAFHAHRCRPLETAFHRLLVFGNGAAWLCWMDWLYK